MTGSLSLYLWDDLLPGLKELVSYGNAIGLAPEERHGLTTRLEAVCHDLEDALNGAGIKRRDNVLSFCHATGRAGE